MLSFIILLLVNVNSMQVHFFEEHDPDYIGNKHGEESQIHDLLDKITKRVSSEIRRVSQHNKTTAERYKSDRIETISDLQNTTRDAQKAYETAQNKTNEANEANEAAKSKTEEADNAKTSATSEHQAAVKYENEKLKSFQSSELAESNGKENAQQKAKVDLSSLERRTSADLTNMCREILLVGKIRLLLRKLNTLEDYADSELHDECQRCLAPNETGTCSTQDLFPEARIQATEPPIPQATEPPIPGTTTRPPIPGTTTRPPIPGTATRPPIPGTATRPPIPGTTTRPPIPGTTTRPPIPGTTTRPPLPNCHYTDGYKIEGNEHSRVPHVPNHRSCCQLCQDTGTFMGCYDYVYDISNRLCILMAGSGNLVSGKYSGSYLPNFVTGWDPYNCWC